MALTSHDFNEIVKKYMASPAGQKQISRVVKKNLLSDAQMRVAAQDLRNRIVKAYLDEIGTSEAKYFDMSTIDIQVRTAKKDGKIPIQVIFKGEGLWRDSLFVGNQGGAEGNAYLNHHGLNIGQDKGYYTGRGVYDIIGLFTQGYDTRTVYGGWVDPRTKREANWARGNVKSLNYRSGSDFVRRMVEEFMKDYPYIEVTYPALWGGTRKPTGNWRRRPDI